MYEIYRYTLMKKMKTMPIRVAILSIPFIMQPIIMARVSGSGRTIAGVTSVTSSVSSSADTGGNTGGNVVTGIATATSSSKAWVSDKNVSIEGTASSEANGKKAEVKGSSTGEDVHVSKQSDDGDAVANVDIHVNPEDSEAVVSSVSDSASASAGDTPTPRVDEAKQAESKDQRSAVGTWWDGVKNFFEKLAGKS